MPFIYKLNIYVKINEVIGRKKTMKQNITFDRLELSELDIALQNRIDELVRRVTLMEAENTEGPRFMTRPELDMLEKFAQEEIDTCTALRKKIEHELNTK